MSPPEEFSPDGDANDNLEPNTPVAYHGGTTGKSPSQTVIETVANSTETDPGRMELLYETIDPDALDRLFERATGRSRPSPNITVSFTYEGCDVTVHSDGRTVVSPLERDER